MNGAINKVVNQKDSEDDDYDSGPKPILPYSSMFIFGSEDPIRVACHYIDAVFIVRTHFCTTNLRIWYFFDQETYIHVISQETRIIRKCFIFNFPSKKGNR